MSIGSVLVAVAVGVVVVAYLARPWRVARKGRTSDREIEAWVARVQAERQARMSRGDEGPVCYCPQCGRRVATGDQFCVGCGARLSGGAG